MQVPEKAKKLLETTVKVGAYAALGSAGSALAWMAVSSMLIDHRRILKSAIPGLEPKRLLTSSGEIAYYASTSGEGRPVVLVHSINAAASTMEMLPLFLHFQGKRPVYALDLPGFGLSARDDKPYSPRIFASAIAELIALEMRDPVDCIALSLGCEFAALAALAVPEFFHSLALLSPTGFSPRTIPYSDSRRKMLSVPAWSQPFYDLLTTRASLRYYLAKSFPKSNVPTELLDYAFDTCHQPGARFAPLYFLGGHLFTATVREEIYGALAMPVRVFYDSDPYVSFEYLDPFLSAKSNWSAIRLQGTNGLPQWQQPAVTAGELDAFFSHAA